MSGQDPNAPIVDYVAPPMTPDPLLATGSTVRLFTATNVSQSDPLPDEWRGHYAHVTALGGDVWWALAADDLQSIDPTLAAAADGGANVQRGSRLLYGNTRNVVLQLPTTGTIYLVRASLFATGVDLQVELA